MFRTAWFYIALIPVTIWYSIKMMLMTRNGTDKKTLDEIPIQWATKLVACAGIKVEADLSGIDPNGHYVFIGNHQSNFDIPIIFSVFQGNGIRFVAKKSLFDIPIFGKALKVARNIPIDRENRRAAMKSLNEAVEITRSGVSPLIFPEGTRNHDPDEFLPFKTGGMIIALKAGLPVVPFVMEGTHDLLPPGKLMFNRKRPVRIKVLPVIDPSRYTLKEREQFKNDLREMMTEAYQQLRKDSAHG